MTVINVETYDLLDVAGSEREDRFEQLLAATHADLRLRLGPADSTGFDATVRRVWIEDLAVVDTDCGPCHGVRTPDLIRRSRDDYVVVLVNLGGREAVSQGGASAVLDPGDVVVWDSARPFRFSVEEPLRKRSLFIPKDALREVGAHRVDVSGLALDPSAPATELLTTYLDVLANTADRLDPAALGSARAATLNLLSAALQPMRVREPDQPTAALRTRILQWIDQNLECAELSPVTIAIAHHVSVRTIHRVFEGSGDTAASHIRTRRLERARDDLVATDNPISTIATRWCFSDASHFTRAFRARYGVPPRAYRVGRQRAAAG